MENNDNSTGEAGRIIWGCPAMPAHTRLLKAEEELKARVAQRRVETGLDAPPLPEPARYEGSLTLGEAVQEMETKGDTHVPEEVMRAAKQVEAYMLRNKFESIGGLLFQSVDKRRSRIIKGLENALVLKDELIKDLRGKSDTLGMRLEVAEHRLKIALLKHDPELAAAHLAQEGGTVRLGEVPIAEQVVVGGPACFSSPLPSYPGATGFPTKPPVPPPGGFLVPGPVAQESYAGPGANGLPCAAIMRAVQVVTDYMGRYGYDSIGGVLLRSAFKPDPDDAAYQALNTRCSNLTDIITARDSLIEVKLRKEERLRSEVAYLEKSLKEARDVNAKQTKWEGAAAEATRLSINLEAIQKEKAALESEVARLSNNLQVVRKEKWEQMEEVKRSEDLRYGLALKNVDLGKEKDALTSRVDHYSLELKEEKENVEELRKSLAAMVTVNGELRVEIEHLRKRDAERANMLHEMGGKLKGYERDLEQQRSYLAAKDMQILEHTGVIRDRGSRMDALVQEVHKHRNERAQMVEAIALNGKRAEELERYLEQLRALFTEAEAFLDHKQDCGLRRASTTRFGSFACDCGLVRMWDRIKATTGTQPRNVCTPVQNTEPEEEKFPPDEAYLLQMACRKLCALRGLNPEQEVVAVIAEKLGPLGHRVPQWTLFQTEVVNFHKLQTALKEAAKA